MTKVFAFIFARGGSKGLPRKNILELGGKPLISHSINLAREHEKIEKVFVSTDCDEIAEVARMDGANIIKRPAELSTDNAPEWLAWQHAIKEVINDGDTFDIFLSLPPTAPLRNCVDIDNCLSMMKHNKDAVITMTAAQRNPWFNMVSKTNEGNVSLVNKGMDIKHRQTAPQCFDMTTVAYAAKINYVLGSKNIWEGNVAGVEIPNERALDIDTLLDFEIASFLLEKKTRDNVNEKK